MDKEFYNEASAAKLGWSPGWFIPNHQQFDRALTKAVREYQRAHGLSADGLCGPSTYRRINTDQQQMSDYKKYHIKNSSEFIYYRGQPIPIQWDRVVTHLDDGALKLTGGRSSYSGKKRNIKFFVNHWDVCLSSESCVKVLNKRNISVHFCIDNDGTIYQLMDLNDAAWHAGGSKWNHSSVGVEIANAYYPKYQGWYERNGFGERPLIEGQKIHGKSMDPFMDFYPIQKEALKALWLACHEGLGIPLESPQTKWAVDSECKSNKFKGFCSHYHLTNRKIDCAGLDIESMLEDVKNNPKFCPDD